MLELLHGSGSVVRESVVRNNKVNIVYETKPSNLDDIISEKGFQGSALAGSSDHIKDWGAHSRPNLQASTITLSHTL